MCQGVPATVEKITCPAPAFSFLSTRREVLLLQWLEGETPVMYEMNAGPPCCGGAGRTCCSARRTHYVPRLHC